MALPETMWSLTTAAAVTTSSADVAAAEAAGRYEDPSKKIRKPYTITKSRESWTKHEHDKFLEALQLFVRDWKKIEAFVGSKTVIQIRSHAQKYFLKVQKNGRSEHVPPPRPKRKAAHPYPQKASKNSSLLSQPPTAFQASTCVLDPGYVSRTEPSSVLWNSSTSGTMPSWTHSSHVMKENLGPGVAMVANNCWCNSESPSGAWPACESNYQGNNVLSICGMPDFVQVYNFIGSVFDPSSGDLLQKLKEMDPIDVETVMLLVENFSINLASPDFEDHFKVLASYDISSEEFKSENANNTLEADETGNGSFMEFKSENANNTLEAGDTGIGSFIDISSEEFKSENANNTLEANETGNGSFMEFKSENANNTLEAGETGNGSFMEFKSENANNTLEAGETGNGSFMVEVEYSEKFQSEVANNTVEAGETGNGSFMVEVSNDEYTVFL